MNNTLYVSSAGSMGKIGGAWCYCDEYDNHFVTDIPGRVGRFTSLDMREYAIIQTCLEAHDGDIIAGTGYMYKDLEKRNYTNIYFTDIMMYLIIDIIKKKDLKFKDIPIEENKAESILKRYLK